LVSPFKEIWLHWFGWIGCIFIFLPICKENKTKFIFFSIRWARHQYGLDWFYTLATASTSYKEKTTLGLYLIIYYYYYYYYYIG
jgi:hypothetical protein